MEPLKASKYAAQRFRESILMQRRIFIFSDVKANYFLCLFLKPSLCKNLPAYQAVLRYNLWESLVLSDSVIRDKHHIKDV